MKPRKEESKKDAQARKEAKKPRFQIVKLEERIAPCHLNPHGKLVGKCSYRY